MNAELFRYAIEIALDAHKEQRQPEFTIAIRVAQSAIDEHPRSCWLLDYALEQFPSPEVPQLLQSISRYLLHQTEHRVAQAI